MTCEPYCEICGGNLRGRTAGSWICIKCRSINETLAPKPSLAIHRQSCS